MTLIRWYPPVESFERRDHLGIRAEAPRAHRNDVLTQHGEHEKDIIFEDENAQQMDSVYGAFTWSFSLPPRSDSAKADVAKPKGIEIKS